MVPRGGGDNFSFGNRLTALILAKIKKREMPVII